MSLMKFYSRIGLSACMILGFAISCKQEPAGKVADQKPNKGKSIYALNCTSCHNSDPAFDGSVGPAIKGAGFDLLKAKITKGEYPPGYKAKRATKAMTKFAMPDEDIAAIASFLAR